MLKTSRNTLVAIFFVVTAVVPALAGEAPDAARHLAFLEWEAGEWDAVIEVTGPEGDTMRFNGEQTDRVGAFSWLITDLRMVAGPDGQQPPPYEGHGVLGYDPAKKKLVGIWIDSKTNWLAVSEGTLDPQGHQLTLQVEGRNPATGDPMPQQYVTTKVDEDTKRLEVSIPLPDGTQMQVATINYTRKPAKLTSAD